MINKASEIKLKVLPLFASIEHKAYYEGPCRFGKGDALKPGYDAHANAALEVRWLDTLGEIAPEGIELMDVVHLARTDDWENPESSWEAIAASVRAADVIVALTGIGCGDRILEFQSRFDKPMLISPVSGFSAASASAAVKSMQQDHEIWGFYKWDDLAYQLKILRARKVVQSTRMLCINRFGDAASMSSRDVFTNIEHITDRLGVRFRYMNLHEYFDRFEPLPEGGNYTTPGRETPNWDEEDQKRLDALLDDICDGAIENSMTREKMAPSIKNYVMAQKCMDLLECNAFAMPCPDACSTRRLNEMQFTPCACHALNLEDGIPSACEYDTVAALSQQALIAVSGMCPYIGNTCPIPYENGKLTPVFGSTKEQYEKLMELGPENLYMVQHSSVHRRMKDPDKIGPYAVHHFAYDQEFGVTFRYDFDADAGQVITLCRFAPDASKMFIGTGEIVMGGNYDGYNCSTMIYFRVKDQAETWEKQCVAGNHCAVVYGDYTNELIDLCKSLDIEPVVAR